MDMRHKWQLRARDTHTERFECACGWVKTVISPGDGFPQTIYTRGLKRTLRAPVCMVELAKVAHEV
jgi:hypothetical protein